MGGTILLVSRFWFMFASRQGVVVHRTVAAVRNWAAPAAMLLATGDACISKGRMLRRTQGKGCAQTFRLSQQLSQKKNAERLLDFLH